jgi:hypothetical protein
VQFGLEVFSLVALFGFALNDVFNVTKDALAGGGAVCRVGRGLRLCRLIYFFGEVDGAADGAGGHVERFDGFWLRRRGDGLPIGRRLGCLEL